MHIHTHAHTYTNMHTHIKTPCTILKLRRKKLKKLTLTFRSVYITVAKFHYFHQRKSDFMKNINKAAM